MKCSTVAEFEYIFTPFITLKDGRRLYARECGKKAFRIPVRKHT